MTKEGIQIFSVLSSNMLRHQQRSVEGATKDGLRYKDTLVAAPNTGKLAFIAACWNQTLKSFDSDVWLLTPLVLVMPL